MSDAELRELAQSAREGGPLEVARYAAALVRVERIDDALEALLVAWRSSRDAGIASVVDEVSASLPKTDAYADDFWLEAAKQTPRASVLPTLLDSLPKGTHAEVAERLDALEHWPDDPRISLALAKLVEACPFRATSSQKAWRRIFARLVRERDVRAIAALERGASGPSNITGASMASWFAGECAKALEKLKQKTKDVSATTDVALAFKTNAPSKKLAKTGSALLLERVLDAPRDHALRIQLGQALESDGDPRGELIAIQARLRDGKSKTGDKGREQALAKQHGKTWAGKLAKLVVFGDSTFELGFFSRVKTKALSEKAATDLTGDPIWATVVTLMTEGPHRESLARMLLDPIFRSLETLIVPGRDGLVGAIAGLPITGLVAWNVDLEEEAGRAALAGLVKLPRLERLAVAGPTVGWKPKLPPSSLAPYLESDASAKLRLLEIDGWNLDVPAWLATLEKKKSIESFVAALTRERDPIWLDEDAPALRWTRGKDGRLSRLHSRGGDKQAAWMLEQLAPGSLEHVTLAAGSQWLADNAEKVGREVAVEE